MDRSASDGSVTDGSSHFASVFWVSALAAHQCVFDGRSDPGWLCGAAAVWTVVGETTGQQHHDGPDLPHPPEHS